MFAIANFAINVALATAETNCRLTQTPILLAYYQAFAFSAKAQKFRRFSGGRFFGFGQFSVFHFVHFSVPGNYPVSHFQNHLPAFS